MQIAQIVPQVKLPRSIEFLDYSIPDELKVSLGDLVGINFRNREINGLVWGISEHPTRSDIQLKKIDRILEKNFVSHRYIQLINDVTQNTFSSLSHFYNLFPKAPKRLRPPVKLRAMSSLQPLTIKKGDLSGVVRTYHEIEASERPVLVQVAIEKNADVLIYKLAENAIKVGQRVIIVSSQINQVVKWQQNLTRLEPPAVLHSELNATQTWQNWRSIQEEKTNLAIGTRQAIFAPFKKTDLIIFTDTESDDLKQGDQNPRYDSREAAIRRAELDGARLVFLSRNPRLVDFYRGETGQFKHIHIGSGQHPFLENFQIINIKEALKESNYYLTENLLNNIRVSLSQKRKVFLLVNHRGVSAALSCQECQYIFKCINCQVSRVVFSQKLICSRCLDASELPLACPNCRSPRLKETGVGTVKIESLLKKILPENKIGRVDSDKKDFDVDSEVIVGTPLFVNRYLDKLSDLGFVGIISADNLLNLANCNSQEQAYQLINHLANLCVQRAIPFCIQTNSPDHFIWRAAMTNDYPGFYQKTIAERKEFNYPPFGHFIKVTIKANGLDKISETLQELQNLASRFSVSRFVRREIPAHKKHNKFHSGLILQTGQEIPESIKIFLKNLPPAHIIDIDPSQLL